MTDNRPAIMNGAANDSTVWSEQDWNAVRAAITAARLNATERRDRDNDDRIDAAIEAGKPLGR